MEDLKKILNERQYAAVTSTSKYLRIIAGAGSGKTRVLTYRIAYLIDNLGYYPSSILAITFTNKAADEIRNRVEKTLNMGHLHMSVATFHSYCARILREECKLLNYPSSFSIIDEDDQKKIVKDIIKEKEIEAKDLKISTCLDYIANKKNQWITPEVELKTTKGNFFKHQEAIIYGAYEDYLQKNHMLDFDDLILKTIKIFTENPHVLEKWQNRLRHILVDEFQDVDNNQFKLLCQLAGDDNEITVVGDPDQTIYTWRGANIQIILNFNKNFPDCESIALEENYRSSGNILNVANQLISHNHNRVKKNLFTKADLGCDISIYVADNEIKEAEYVVNNILDLYDGQNIFYKDFAILYRANSQSAPIEQILMNRGIKYKIYGGIRFYRRMEIKDCIAYLKFATNLSDDFSALRLIENTGRGIGKTTLDKIKANAQTENVSIYEHLKNNLDNLKDFYMGKQSASLRSFIIQIQELHDKFLFEPKKANVILDDHLHKYGYFDMLIANEMDDKIDNVHKFIEQMRDFLMKDDATLDEFVQNVSLMSSQDEINDQQATDDYVKLMTVHTAKGLEFDNVFVYGLVESIFPSSRTIMESIDGIEEERRLFYVAITRARKRLFLSTSGGYSYMGLRQPSRFLKEIKFKAQEENIAIKKGQDKPLLPTNIRAGSLIKHDIFGEGIVLNEHDGLIDVVFKDPKFGRKTLVASHKFVHLIK